MTKSFFSKVDRFYVAYVTLMIIALVVGAVCGIILTALGIASYFGVIDLGDLQDTVGTPWLVFGGVGITLGTIVSISPIKEKREEVRKRIKQTENPSPNQNIAPKARQPR